MAIQFSCPHCRQTLRVADRFAGARIRCPKCRVVTAAPSAAQSPGAAAASPTPSARLKAQEVKPSAKARPASVDDDEPVNFSRQREYDDIDFTSVMDCVFLLLIFFMVTAAYNLQKSLEIPKPSDDSAITQANIVDPEEGNIVIRIDRDSTVWVNDSEAPSEQDLLVKLREAKAGVPGTDSAPINSALVMANEDALHEIVVMALDACNAVGMEPIKLAVVNEDDF